MRRKTREYTDQSTTLTLYKNLVLSHSDYCDIVYMTANITVLQKLQLLQNSARRTILFAESRESTQEMHSTLGLLYIHKHGNLHLCIQLHKNVYCDETKSLCQFFVPLINITSRYTRGTVSKCMQVAKLRRDLGRKAFSCQGPSQWNKLPNDLRQIEKFLLSDI